MKNQLRFPDGFLWGAATSSYQVEGGIENNDWAQAARDGKEPIAGLACDHYHRYQEDFDIAKSLSHNAHRFSVEWARIEPKEGKFDEKEIEHYRHVLDALRARGIRPMVTLWHFTLPQWLADQGGVRAFRFSEYFARYCAHVVERFGPGDILYVTINEPLIFSSLGWWQGKWPPFKKQALLGFLAVGVNLAHAHNTAYRMAKKVSPSSVIGIVKNNKHVEVGTNPFWVLIGWVIRWYRNRWFLNRTRGSFDFIGINYYFHQMLGVKRDLPKTDFGWPIFPEGLYHVLTEVKRYGKPIYVTENGLADADDDQRTDFIRDHLYWMHRAIQDGADVHGYFHWSLLDNYEWAEGYRMRFGLVEVDFATQERKVRDSAQVYKKICETNMLEY